jgi:hypothetical protein
MCTLRWYQRAAGGRHGGAARGRADPGVDGLQKADAREGLHEARDKACAARQVGLGRSAVSEVERCLISQ